METKIENFYDKVYACWLGKNIGGTLGGPLEGRTELLDVKGYTQEFLVPMENDDLDLQLINLHAVEQYGGAVSAQRIADEWLAHVHFQYDEYGHALTNLRKGMKLPLAGRFNNYFTDCMGSPIRSEIWGVIAAGNPDLAAFYAFEDATVDHAGGEGVYGEIFFAVFESMAFCNTNINELIEKSLSYIPADCTTALAVKHLLAEKAAGKSWKETRQSLIDAFGTENFTYAPINIAFTLMGLVFSEGSFTERLLITTNCSYDTDCTCATLASMMGILYGSKYIDEMWTKPLGEKIIVSAPVNGFDAPKTIKELTDRSILARDTALALYNSARDKSIFVNDLETEKEKTVLPEYSFQEYDLLCEVRYGDNLPAVMPEGNKKVSLTITNKSSENCTFVIKAKSGNLKFEPNQTKITINPQESFVYSESFVPINKQAVYNGEFEIVKLQNGRIWRKFYVPFTLLATCDFKVLADGKETMVYSPTNKIFFEKGHEKTVLTTNLEIFDEIINAKVVVTCPYPITLSIDGSKVVDCDKKSTAIPAYHRSFKEKCTFINLKKGTHLVEIEVKDKEADYIHFYVVDQDFCWVPDLEYTLSNK